MKRAISTMLRNILSSLLTVGLLVIALLILWLYLPGVFSPPIAAPITSPASSTTTVITGTLSYGDALKTYEGVATSAIHASERALDTIKWLVGALFGLTTVATGVAAYLYKTAREAGEKAQLAEEAAQAAREAANSARGQLATLLERYIRLSEQYVELKGKTLSLDAALQAWDRGEISRHKVIEAQQWGSWVKWQKQKDDTGWHELKEEADWGGGLTPVVRLAVEMELERVRRQASKTGSQSDEENEYEQRLQNLLHAQSVE
jgi:hypothetical protein